MASPLQPSGEQDLAQFFFCSAGAPWYQELFLSGHELCLETQAARVVLRRLTPTGAAECVGRLRYGSTVCVLYSLCFLLSRQVEEKAKFDGIFESLLPVNGLLSGDKVKPVLMNSKLPLDVLGRVRGWLGCFLILYCSVFGC